MIFNTWSFGVFAVIALTIYWALVPERWKPQYLVFVGCIFYALSVPGYLVLILALGTVTFLIGRAILANAHDPAAKRRWLTVGVILIAGVLIAFKYSKFFATTINQVARHDIVPFPDIVVPLAISFFTFEFVHVVVDVYQGKIERLDLLDFAAFAMFFPTLVAGPIKRYQSFAPQVRHVTLPDDGTILLNLYRITMGLAKKLIIADSMSTLTQPLLAPDANPYGRLDFIVAIFAYAAKIYFDFSGYSDIAIGLGGLLGIHLPENFDRPYLSENISIFWRRWHTSLSAWIRDYIFIPLGGSRRPPLVTAVNLFVAMAIAGLWHGAAWTFVLWGLWHGLGLVVHRFWSMQVVPKVAWLRSGSLPVRVGSTVLTFVFVVFGWVLFAASSLQAAIIAFIRIIS